ERSQTMYASLRHYQFKPGTAAEVTRLVQENFVPVIRQASGFVAYYVVFEENDRGTAISLFESQAQAEASVQLAADWVKQLLAELVVGPPTIIAGEGTVHQAG